MYPVNFHRSLIIIVWYRGLFSMQLSTRLWEISHTPIFSLPDIKQCFDSIWLDEATNNLFDSGMTSYMIGREICITIWQIFLKLRKFQGLISLMPSIERRISVIFVFFGPKISHFCKITWVIKKNNIFYPDQWNVISDQDFTTADRFKKLLDIIRTGFRIKISGWLR